MTIFDNNLKNEIKRIHPDTLINRGFAQAANTSGIVCPHCGNGTHDAGTGLEFKQDANGFWKAHCFRCGENFDILRLVAEHFGYNLHNDFPKVITEGATLLGASAGFSDFRHNHNAKKNFTADKKAEDKKDSTPPNYQKFLDGAHITLQNLPEVSRRGFDLATLAHFANGFQKDWQHPNSANMPKSDRWIIPTSPHHYLALAIDSNTPEKFRKIHVGRKEIFNLRDLQNFRTVIVMEGEVNVMSVWQASSGEIACIAVSGCSNFKMLLDYLKNHPELSDIKFIVVFDNDSKGDNAGQTNAHKFVAELKKMGYPAVNKLLSERFDFDANDWLQENQDALRERLFDIYDESVAELEKVADEIQKEKDFQAEVDDFVINNGSIPDGIIDEIKAAISTLTSFTVDNFDARLLSNESFRRKLGLCSFYTFANYALDHFSEVFWQKFKAVKPKIKAGVNLDDTEKPFINFDDNFLKRLIRRSSKAVEFIHSEFNKEKKRQQKEQLRQQKRLEEEQAKFEGEEYLKYLHTLPQTDERDFEIRQLILSLCDYQRDKYGNILYIKTSVNNFRLIFNYDPLIRGLFGYDAFSESIVFTREPFWRDQTNDTSRIGTPFKDIDIDNLANYISSNYDEINCKTNFNRQISEYATRRTFHPIKSYFQKLPKWDGTPRAEKIFIDFLGIEDSPYSREVTLNLFIASLARVYHPGCEYQYMPIFQGEQGIGKGKVLKMLVDAVYKPSYVEMHKKLSDSHAVDVLRLAWFVEMPELYSMRGVSEEAVKTFISARSDSNRFAYDKDPSTINRHCVFFGSANKKFILKDKTGNRRFLILKSNLKENEYVSGLTDDYIAQFWAEVFAKFQALFKDGFDENKLLLSKESIVTAAEIAKSCVEDDGLSSDIHAFLGYPILDESVWRLLSKAERRQFFENGGFLSISEQVLKGKQSARRRPDEMQKLEEVISRVNDPNDFSVQMIDGKLTFYGTEEREHICAAEIRDECFSTLDKRISISRIAEVLESELIKEGWLKKTHKDKIYGYQPNTYFRHSSDDEEVVADTEPLNATQEQLHSESPQKQNSIPDNLTIDSLQNSQPESNTASHDDSKLADDDNVTLISSGVYVEDEEFLDENETADDDFEQFHDLQ